MGVRGTIESRSEDQSRVKSEESGGHWPPTAPVRTPTPHRLASERVTQERTTEEMIEKLHTKTSSAMHWQAYVSSAWRGHMSALTPVLAVLRRQ